MHFSSFLPHILAKLGNWQTINDNIITCPDLSKRIVSTGAKKLLLVWSQVLTFLYSQTCRLRKVKCDGTFPVCRTCQKSGRICEREIHPSPAIHALNTDVIEFASQDLGKQDGSSSQTTPDLPAPDSPRNALRDRRICSIFQHYIRNLAPWYDLNDRLRRFEDVVPRYALDDPLLFSAVLAFSAVHLSSLTSQARFQYIAEFYHLQSIRRLIAVTDNGERVYDGTTLVTTCLLRSYEILAESVGTQSHLHGSSSFLVGQRINIGADLISAGFWNYLREDITVALMEKRRLKIDLSKIWMSQPVEDDDRANMISLLLGKVINICLGEDARALGFSEWKSLKGEADEWKKDLPQRFEPISFAGPTESGFPELLLFHGWQIAALQYYHTIMSILILAEPGSVHLNAWQKTNQINDMHRQLESHAVELCALAISNESNAARVNAFGPISFCGVWVSDPTQRNELIAELKRWQETTAWPVDTIIRALCSSWNISSGPHR